MNSGRSISTTNRRWFLRSISSLAILPLGGCNATAACPLCGGRLSTVGSHIDFRLLPSVNHAVWDRSSDHVGCTGYEPGFEAPPPPTVAANGEVEISCGPEFNSQSPFCKRCFLAFSQRDQHWVRWMDSPKSFVLPLSRQPSPSAKDHTVICAIARFHIINPWSRANAMAWVRDQTPSLSKTFEA